MLGRRRSPLLTRLLFVLTVMAAAALLVTVCLSPWLDSGTAHPQGWPRLLAVFARDAAVRKTTLAGALGLLVTAFVFFRPPVLARPVRRPSKTTKPPPPGRVVGA